MVTKKEYCEFWLKSHGHSLNPKPSIIESIVKDSTTAGICYQTLGIISQSNYTYLNDYLNTKAGVMAIGDSGPNSVHILSFREFLGLLPTVHPDDDIDDIRDDAMVTVW